MLMKDAAEQKAEGVLVRELRAAGLTKKALTAKRAPPMEARQAVRARKPRVHAWIARRLNLGSVSVACHQKYSAIQYSSPDPFRA